MLSIVFGSIGIGCLIALYLVCKDDTMITKTCTRCGKDYETRYGAKYNPFECKVCEKKREDRLKENVSDYRGVRVVREPQLQGK